jgi:signal transduction histidine kinase
MIGRTILKRSLTERQKEDLDFFEALKPYLGKCLTLNHDLNNPLSGIMGFTEFLLEESDQLSEEHREFVVQINQCAERMHQVLDGLSEKKIALSEKVDIRSVVEKYQPSDKLSD